MKNTNLMKTYHQHGQGKVPMLFDTVPTIRHKGKTDLKGSTTGGQKEHFTSFLAMNAAGDFLPTFTILKGKRAIKNLDPSPGWFVTLNDKLCMGEETMLQWIKRFLDCTHSEDLLCFWTLSLLNHSQSSDCSKESELLSCCYPCGLHQQGTTSRRCHQQTIQG